MNDNITNGVSGRRQGWYLYQLLLISLVYSASHGVKVIRVCAGNQYGLRKVLYEYPANLQILLAYNTLCILLVVVCVVLSRHYLRARTLLQYCVTIPAIFMALWLAYALFNPYHQ
ncbi:hypothetical protein HED60_09265 [Planctomycetales bacterium ZRK34]|nr:hypothetical protein HED60_09265 [Planctomycetales bacterium ZRK34]